ncbi:Alpha-amylase A type-1/2 [Cyphellophora attinorum]|uniref:Alpha-amylase A type-1/2 n=1 Tax=Cyphellophora attinorum TaxID=1664694 RepID=A0A0N1GZ21_9EURO|nr:Alpha-amylase A type-1/2 [Phialophora attinorum]KPI36142.1 Alpha-amylase A type-1/2 [Phialophora attinorum]
MGFILWLLAAACFLQPFTIAADTAAWKSRNIYFALTDRISRNASDEGGNACGDLGNYCGGTFKGLESKLDYISGMGFDAIWITPVVKNRPRGYHGYWAQDLYSINENYGTADDLKDLVNAAHDKNMFVMADVVANHMGAGPISENSLALLTQQSAYHPACDIEQDDYDNNQTAVEECRLAGLPDLNTQSREVRQLFQDWIKWLVSEYSFDGIRIDTVKHVEQDFWPGFVEASGVYAIGEVLNGAPPYLAEYAKLMPGLLNYAMYYALQDFFLQKSGASRIVEMHDWISSIFPDPAALGTFVDNHDQMRWLAQRDDVAVLKNVLAYVILARGIPIVYYGTEQGFSGASDPFNREDLWRSGFNTEADLYQTIARLSEARLDAGV